MMRGLSAGRRAEEFNAALEGGASAAGVADETSGFLALVGQLRDVEPPPMRSEFSADLRTRLLLAAPAELANVATAPARRPRTTTPGPYVERPRHRAIRVLAASCLVLATGVGVAAASQSALPGEPLYQVKRTVERIQVVTAGSAVDRGTVLLDQATTRLTEVQDLAIASPDDPSTSSLISETLDDFRDQAGDGASSFMTSYEDDATVQSIVAVRTFATDSADRLDGLSDIVPASARDDLVAAAEAMTELDADARQVCPACSSLVPVKLSTALIDLQSDTQQPLDLGTDPAAPGHPGTSPGTPSVVLPTLPGQTQDGQPTLPDDTPGNPDGTAPTDPGTTVPRIPTHEPSLPVPSIPVPPLPSLPASPPVPSLPATPPLP